MDWFLALVIVSLILMIFKNGLFMMLVLWIWYVSYVTKTYGDTVDDRLGKHILVGIVLLVIKLIGDLNLL